MLDPKIEGKAPKLLFGGLISTFYALADINSNANTIEKRALIREGTQSAFSRLVHQVSDWCSGAAAYFGWVREAKRKNTRCGL
jgi:hypothetical protein